MYHSPILQRHNVPNNVPLLGMAMSGKPIIDGYEIDHINRNKADYRLANLRYGPHHHNAWNVDPRKTKSDRSIPVGVFRKRKRWSARIKCQNAFLSLGVFDTIEEAGQAREDFVNKYYAMYVDGIYRPELFNGGMAPINFSSLSKADERWLNAIGSL